MKSTNFIISLLLPFLLNFQIDAAGNFQKDLQAEMTEHINKLLRKFNVNAQDAQGRTPLFIAAQYNLTEIIQDLIENPELDLNKSDHDGLTPLHIAIIEQNVDAVQALLKNLVTANNNGFSGSDSTETNNLKGCINLNSRDKSDYTPVLRAILANNADILKILLDKGASPVLGKNRFDAKKGKMVNLTPTDFAKQKESKERAANFCTIL